jgi:CubicO group peptidase (beta-lactamase class C family)
MLTERGVIDPDALVTAYWPEFGAAGKDQVTVGMVASHTAGLPYPPLGTGLQGLDLQRGPAITAALAGATPLWSPGKPWHTTRSCSARCSTRSSSGPAASASASRSGP